MEYSFSTAPETPPYVLTLTDTSLVISHGKKVRELPYQDIQYVYIEKKKEACKIHIEGKGVLSFTIPNYSLDNDGALLDKSNAYTLFVRLLHYHLLSKSKAEFYINNGYKQTGLFALGILVLAGIIVTILRLLNWTFDLFTLTLIIIGTVTPILVLVWLSRFPKPYKPADIPLDFLP